MGKPGIVPSKGSPSCQLAAAGKISAQLMYGGGPLLTNIDVISIYWGSLWATDAGHAAIMTSLEEFYRFLVTSSYITQLQEYSVPDSNGRSSNYGRTFRVGVSR